MSTNTRDDALAGLLFGEDRKLLNFKMCRGDDPDVKEQDLRDEAHSALLQVRLGKCSTLSDFPGEEDVRTVKIDDLARLTV